MTDNPQFQTYQPESWWMLKDSIYAAQAALRIGIENSQELLAKHDVELGREHRGNRLAAERMEREIAEMKIALEGLAKPNGSEYGVQL